MNKKKLVGFYDYTVVLTYLGMIIAFNGILSAINLQFTKAIFCLMAAGVCDMFDGAIASTKDRNKYEKHFGIQIDSLSDLISFGVLPAVFVYRFTGDNRVSAVVSSFYLLCALIRLAYYNVQEADRQEKTTERRECFLGLPVTTAAIVLPILFFVTRAFPTPDMVIFPLVQGLLAAGFISGFEVKKPDLVGKVANIASVITSNR